jgi:hypothetical protein
MENNIRYFQWIVGDRRGEILVFDQIEVEDSDTYINFKDGSRINEDFVAPLNQTDLTGKMMAEIDHPNNCWRFKEREEEKPRIEQDAETGVKYEIPSAEDIVHADLTENGGVVKNIKPKNKIIDLIPPKPTKKGSIFGTISNMPISNIQHLEKLPEQSKHINETDPVYILMSKSKKTDSDITMTMTIALPSKSLYNIAKESFEGGDQKFIEYIIENITVNEIKDALKVAITDMYENASINDLTGTANDLIV